MLFGAHQFQFGVDLHSVGHGSQGAGPQPAWLVCNRGRSASVLGRQLVSVSILRRYVGSIIVESKRRAGYIVTGMFGFPESGVSSQLIPYGAQ